MGRLYPQKTNQGEVSMWKYILKRLGYMLLTLLAVVSITFLLVHSIPGDPFTSMVEDLPEETRQLYMEKYGFDQPLIVQYVRYIKQLLTGDLGASLRYPGRKVGEIVSQYAPVSASIGGLALGFGIVLGLTLGIVAALKQNRWPDRLVMVLALMGTAIPTFVIAAVLQYALTVTWPVFPTTGYGTWKHLVLPVHACVFHLLPLMPGICAPACWIPPDRTIFSLPRQKASAASTSLPGIFCAMLFFPALL